MRAKRLPPIRLCGALLPAILCGEAVAGGLLPAVTIKSPAPGAVVAGEIAVYAEAAEAGAGVISVQFALDGAALGEEDATPPYSVTWDTADHGDGAHSLAALALLADGRMVYSAPVRVTVANEPPLQPGVTRFEETDPAVVYGYNWTAETGYGSWSGGSAKYIVYTPEAAAFATFAFTGSGVSWIGYRGRYGGIVRVYIDGALIGELDTYRPEEETAVPVYTVTGLVPGAHSLMLELTGSKDPAALGSETAIDAFDVYQ